MVPQNNLKIEYIPINDLVEYARNPRKNNEVIEKMCAAIKEFGFKVPIIAKSDGTVVDGHLRLKAAKALGLEKVPVIYADDLTEAQVKAFRILANKSANWADWDDELLKLEFEELRDMDFDLELTGFDLDEINEDYLDLSNSETLGDDFEEISEPDSSKEPISKLGDLWILGDHQVLCGDSTNAEVFQRILDGRTADLTVTDPPYNVNYEQDGKKILNDNLGTRFEEFLAQICRNILDYTDGAIYMFMAISEIGNLKREFEKAVCHYARKLKRFCVFNDECFEDLEQELIAYVFEKLPAYDSQKSALSTFVSRILETKSKKMLRSRTALKRGFRHFSRHIDPMDEKTHPGYEEDLSNSINPNTFCKQFPSKLRQTCELLKEHSVFEIAEILNVSLATVYHRILKMRSLLKEKMNENNEFK